MSPKKILYIILFLAIVIRLVGISSNPPALNWDEVSHGFNAYSILKTGKDEWSVAFPIIFRGYGDYKLPVYIYLTAISEVFFGTSTFAVRFTSAIAGVVTVLFTYLLAKRIFKAERIALISSLLVAFEPWDFFLSRIGVEANLALALIVSGYYFYLVGLKVKKYLILSAILLGLSVWTYNSARVFVPLLLFGSILLDRKNFSKITKEYVKFTIGLIAVLALFFVPMFLQLINPVGRARFSNVEILDAGAVNNIVSLRNESTLPPVVTKIIYNRPTYFVTTFAKNYISHFSPKFLYISGGDNYQFNVPGHGLLYAAGAPFLLVGLYFCIKDKRWRLLMWLLLAPIASSFTRETPHTLRAITMLPIPMLLTAVGIEEAYRRIKVHKWIIISVIFIGFLINASGYFVAYSTNYPKQYSQVWQYGYGQVVQYIKDNYSKYNKILITKKYGEPHEFMLFYWPWQPDKYYNDPNLERFYQSNWYWVDKFDKFYFFNDWEAPSDNSKWALESGENVPIDGNVLLVTSPGNYPVGWRVVKTVNFLDGEVAFEILEQ